MKLCLLTCVKLVLQSLTLISIVHDKNSNPSSFGGQSHAKDHGVDIV